jgi:hypothetical protein
MRRIFLTLLLMAVAFFGSASVAFAAGENVSEASLFIAPGSVVWASGELVNDGSTPLAISDAVLTARDPQHPNGNPWYDFSGRAGARTIQPGGKLVLRGSLSIPATAPTGTWQKWVAYKTTDGVWHDGPKTTFDVAARGATGVSGGTAPSPTPTPTPSPTPSPEPTPTPSPTPSPEPTPSPTPTPTPSPEPAPGAALYVSPFGSDANDGRSPLTAWKSVAKVNSTVIPTGTAVLFERGGTWSGTTLEVTESGITIGAYGEGARPIFRDGGVSGCINVTGNDNVVQDVQARDCYLRGRAGIRVTGDRNLVQRTYITKNEAGVVIPSGADDNRLLHNELIANDVMTVNNCDNGDNDYGAYSFANEGGLRTEIGYNEIRDARGPSCDYGNDGSCLEIFRGSANFHHNLCVNAPAGTESSGVAAGHRVHHNRFVNAPPVIQQPDNKFAMFNQPWVLEYNNVIGSMGWSAAAGKVTVRRNLYTSTLVSGSGANYDNNLKVAASEFDADYEHPSTAYGTKAG